MGFGPLVLAMVIPFGVTGHLACLSLIFATKSNPRPPLSLYGASYRGGGLADHHEEVAMPAGSAMTSASARQARCINRAAEAWLHSARPQQKKPRREAGLSCCSLT